MASIALDSIGSTGGITGRSMIPACHIRGARS
jgi:hypothetical protein